MTNRQVAYRGFLASAFWRELSARKRARVGRCERCGRRGGLQAHHHRYPEDWFDTTERDLTVLCADCHARAHRKKVAPRAPRVARRSFVLKWAADLLRIIWESAP